MSKGWMIVLFLEGCYYFWRCYIRHDSVWDATVFPIRWFCDKTGIWKPPTEGPLEPVRVGWEEHRKRHVLLHESLDELWADYLRHHLPTGVKYFKGMDQVSVGELIRWSHSQTQEPTE